MDQQITDNKLIAEFDGLTQYRGKWQRDTIATVAKNSNGLKYHADWNWLMPIVEKIGNLKNRIIIHKDFKLIYCEIICRIKHEINKEILEFGKTAIEATYKAVVEFIKWYNKERK